MATRVLCVDDESTFLNGLKANLRRHFDVTLAVGSVAGIALLKTQGPFSIVLSDMRMPLMDGANFLKRVREIAPSTIRMLLTGEADLQAAVSAVNEGQVFRFLLKPCPPEELIGALKAAEEAFQARMAERVLLEQTLRGTVNLLAEILALSNPEIYGQGLRIKRQVVEVARCLGIQETWQFEIAAMLSLIGFVTVPPRIIHKIQVGSPLMPDERRLIDRMPEATDHLLANIPRLEDIREILRHRDQRFDGAGATEAIAGEDLPLGARLLKLASDLDALEGRGMAPGAAIATLRSRVGCYDPNLIDALERHLTVASSAQVLELRLVDIQLGMLFAEDVRSEAGALLIARGHQVTDSMLVRLKHSATELGIKEPLRMIVPHTTS